MTDVKIGVIEQRLATLEKTLMDVAGSLRTLAEDMHKIATFEFRVGALEREHRELRDSIKRLHERLDLLSQNSFGHGIKIGTAERLFWILITVGVGLAAKHFG